MLAKTSILLLVSFGAIDPNSLCVNAVNTIPQSVLHQRLMRSQPEQKPLEAKVDLNDLLEAEVDTPLEKRAFPELLGKEVDAFEEKTGAGKGLRSKKRRPKALSPKKKAAQGKFFEGQPNPCVRDTDPSLCATIGQNNRCRANTQQGKDQRNKCCKTCKTALMEVIFGGEAKKRSWVLGGRRIVSYPAGTGGQLLLPEELKAQQCTHDKCEECGSTTNCFRGAHDERKYYRWGNMMTLSVKRGLPFTSYRASAYAKCDAGDQTKLIVVTREMENGELKVFKDGIHLKTLKKEGTTCQGDFEGCHKEGLEEWDYTHQGDGGAFEVSVEFFPTKPKESSKVTLKLEMDNVRPQFEQCMGHKTCLIAMGNMKHAASYALRNKNEYQLVCLKRETFVGAASFGGKMKPVCEVWRSCVEKVPQLAHVLKTSLSVSNPSLLQVGAMSVKKATRQKDECLDPSIADVEALECECMDWLQRVCGDNEDEQGCYKSKFCEHKGVCCDWKMDNECPESTMNECPGLLLQTETGEEAAAEAEAKRRSPKAYMALAAKRRSQQTENSSSANILTDNLEGALQGKCASQD